MDVTLAQKAVLQPSQAVEDGTLQVKGYNFNGDMDYEKIFNSYLTTGFQATHLSNAIEEINKMLNERDAVLKLEEDVDPCFPYPDGRKRRSLTIFLGYTSNLVSSGLRDMFRFLAQHDLIDCIVTSAGGVEEDLIKCLKPTYLGSFKMNGTILREKGLNRAGNLLIPNENYCAFEEWLIPILNKCLEEQENKEQPIFWTPSKLIHRLGKEINNEESICYWAYRNNIPIFCPALTDGSLGDMLYFHSVANAPGLRLDIVEDVRHINTMAVKSFKTGVIILGGGFVKHHINNANLMRNGSDYTVYVNTGLEFDGSDSGAEPDEAVSWGKVKSTTKAVKVTADATLVFPIIMAKCFARRKHTSSSNTTPSLTRGSATLASVENLRVPVNQSHSSYVKFGFTTFDETTTKWQNGCSIPGAVSAPVNAQVVFVGNVTKNHAVVVKKHKRELHIELDQSEAAARQFLCDYDAGDSVYFMFPNSEEEIAIILQRIGMLGISADKCFTIEKDSSRPSHIPNPCSLRYLLKYCLDIRRSPNRPLLRALAEHCSNASEKRRLLELCSTQGTDEFTTFVRKAGLSLVDLLLAFPSCKPSMECLIDLLPRLLPRAYSISNYKDGWGAKLRFVYSLLRTFGDGIQFPRYGGCSGWMNSLRVGDIVQVALKEPSKFRLPPILKPDLDITKCPLILIGPGTGVAPFISFLQKIQSIIGTSRGTNTVKRYLFYGSSDLSEEFLFQEELKQLQEAGILTDLILCESRPKISESTHPKYVYDALKEKYYEIAELLVSEKHDPPALIFSCGDVKNMSKELWACFGDICKRCLGFYPVEVVNFLQRLRTEERFIEDVWS